MVKQGKYKVPRSTIAVHEPVMQVLKRLKAEHGDVPFDALFLHLAAEHDAAQANSGSRKDIPARHLVEPRHDGIIRILDDEAEAERLGKDEYERRHGTPEQNAEILEAIGASSPAVQPYIPHYGRGRPPGAKDLKPRIRRRKLALVNSEGE